MMEKLQIQIYFCFKETVIAFRLIRHDRRHRYQCTRERSEGPIAWQSECKCV